LHLKAGDVVLDVGCGWGGFAIFAAKYYGCHCVAFALTEEMVAGARKQAVRHGVNVVSGPPPNRRTKLSGIEGRGTTGGTVQFHVNSHHIMADFDDATFDAMACIGVFEHFHVPQYPFLFREFNRIIKPGGYGLIHAMSSVQKPNIPDAFVQKYLFPESNQMVLSDICEGAELHNMHIVDVEDIGPHYAFTLKCWWERSSAHFKANPSQYSTQFIRLWELYLQTGQAWFAFGDASLYQVNFFNDSRTPRYLVRENW